MTQPAYTRAARLFVAVCAVTFFFWCCVFDPVFAGARTTHVDGVSDQNLAHWDNAAFDIPSFSSAYFPNLFHAIWAGGAPAPRITLARFVVPWDAMADTSDEALHYQLFSAWLTDVRWLGLTPDLAIEQSEAVVAGLPRIPPSAALYTRYVGALLTRAAAAGEPISYLEAWNEPNNDGVGPIDVGHPSATAAARFMDAATSLCAADGCTPIAGDFLDSLYARPGHAESFEDVGGRAVGLGVSYEDAYIAALSPSDPPGWGFHPYASVRYHTSAPVALFEEHLPGGPSGHSVSFTEIGAYYCHLGGAYPVGGPSAKEAQQASDAEYLRTLLGSFDITHAFYYELSNGYRAATHCATGPDTSLYTDTDRPRAAASIVFGGPIPEPSPPGIISLAAAAVRYTRAVLRWASW